MQYCSTPAMLAGAAGVTDGRPPPRPPKMPFCPDPSPGNCAPAGRAANWSIASTTTLQMVARAGCVQSLTVIHPPQPSFSVSPDDCDQKEIGSNNHPFMHCHAEVPFQLSFQRRKHGKGCGTPETSLCGQVMIVKIRSMIPK